ncbi:MAG: IS3 family transposase [Phycisphaerales bacterium]|jgi:transposase InsO family protein|nr:IS3 family transposase [Phycisphaerales bacterium]
MGQRDDGELLGTLKTELVNNEYYVTRQVAHRSIFAYIEVFDNRKRLHSTLGYQSPEAFEVGLN